MQNRVVPATAGVLSIVALAGGVVFRSLGWPNQLVLTAAGFLLLSLVYLPARFLGQGDGWPSRWVQTIGLVATAALPLALGLGSVSVQGVSLELVGAAGLALAAYWAWLLVQWRRRASLPLRWRHWVLYAACVGCLVVSVPPPGIVADNDYRGPVVRPAYQPARGPLVLVDEGHGNASTLDGSYWAFGRALTDDGYRVRVLRAPFTVDELSPARILVIVNALNREALGRSAASPLPAFTEDEIASVASWVAQGGSLLLIADHRPFAGAAADLAATMGFTFLDGFADAESGGEDVFSRDSGAIPASVIADGRHRSERVTQVQTFVGQAISVPSDAMPVLVFGRGYRLWPSLETWRARRPADGISVSGCVQLAARHHGDGRVVVAGDSAIFTAQLEHGLSWRRIGMNAPRARDNHRLLLNVVHWLDHLLP